MTNNTNKVQKKRWVKLTRVLAAAAYMSPAAAIAQTLSCPQSLLFGNYTTCSSTETSTISPAGIRTLSGCLSAGGAPFNTGQCNVTQTFPVINVSISVAAASYNITNTTTATMLVDKFSCRFQATATTTTGACSFSTTGFFLLMDIGARLNVANPQAGGSYNGTFTVQTNFP